MMSTNGTEVQDSGETRVADGESGADIAEPTVSEEPEPLGEATVASIEAKSAAASRDRKSISFTVRGLVMGVVMAALVAAVVAFAWMYFDARHELNAQAAQASNDARAEKSALDYAVNAATMDFKDLQSWHVRLVAGTSPELNRKLSDAGKSMEQVLVPLEWSSTAQPLVAKVRSSTGGIYVVDSFVSVQTKTVQAPEALQSTATYSVTIDSNNNWQITDVGGLGSALGPK